MEMFFQVAIVISLIVFALACLQYRSDSNNKFLKLSVLTLTLCVGGFLLSHQVKL